MFDAAYKRPVPRYARTVGVVTAPTGGRAGYHQHIRKAESLCADYSVSRQVQGEGAVSSIIKGIRALEKKKVDVIIVGRAEEVLKTCGRSTKNRGQGDL